MLICAACDERFPTRVHLDAHECKLYPQAAPRAWIDHYRLPIRGKFSDEKGGTMNFYSADGSWVLDTSVVLAPEIRRAVNGWDSLKAENLKLRAALEEIAAKSGNHSECPVGFCVDRVAKEALSTVKP